jgi:uncharacterized protein YggE
MPRQLFAAIPLILALGMAAPANAEDVKMPRTIALSGHGEVKLAPDMAVVTAGVSTQGATAAEALIANSAAMNAVFESLKAEGIEAKDIQTSNFTVQPRYDYNDNTQPPKLAGYDVSNSVTVNVRNIDRLGGLLDRIVQAGSNQINGVMLQVAEPEAALDEARKRATQDAARKAKLYAQAMSVVLGSVLSISESTGYEPPMPLRMNKMSAEGMASSVPVAGGEQTLSVDVNIVWEIR